MNSPPRAAMFCIFAVILLTTCTFEGGLVSPLQRKLSWYSYLNAADLRRECEPGKHDAARLIYNAIHTEQIRTYEFTATPEGANAGVLYSRVLGPASLSKLTDGILGPWVGASSETHIRTEDVDNFWASMESSDALGAAPSGLHLKSEKFFWLTAACRKGRFYYNAYLWPSDRFGAIKFDDLLFAWDMTGSAANPPRDATNFDIYGDASPTRKHGAYYQVTIGASGLSGY